MPTSIRQPNFPTRTSGAQRAEVVRTLCDLAVRGLPRMIDPDSGLYCHARTMTPDGSMARRGTSVRYTAIALLGAADLDDAAMRRALGGADGATRADRLVEHLAGATAADTALAAWALARLAHPAARACTRILDRLIAAPMDTVALAWSMLAMDAARRAGLPVDVDAPLADLRRRLLALRKPAALFAAHESPRGRQALRRHVACFADQVYPILAFTALARHGDDEALEAARACADVLVRRQGTDGQWWWHYDVRHGGVVEPYPVYAVHQDAMGPMALRALAAAGGPEHAEAIDRSLAWLHHAPEVERTLVDATRDVVWRKVDRTDRLKAVRSVRAMTTRFAGDVRLGWLDGVAPPTRLDRECRPYHLGWILYTWAADRATSRQPDASACIPS